MNSECYVEIVEEGSEIDAGILATFDNKCFNEDDAMSCDEWLEVLKDSNTRIFYVYYKHIMAGVAVLKLTNFEIAYFYSTAVDPSFRRLGLAKKLHEARRDYCYERNKTRLQAHTRTDNEASGKLLQYFGWKCHSYIPDYYGDYQDGILWTNF